MRPSTAPRRPRVHIRIPEFSRDVRRCASYALDGGSVPKELYKQVIACLRAYRDSVIPTGDYMHAQEVEDKINVLMLGHQKEKYENGQLDTYQELQKRLERAREDLKVAEENRRIYVEDVDRRQAEEEVELAEMQRDELRQLEEQYSGEPPPKFVRWSPGYLNMRRKEKFLVKAKRYVEAHDMKCQADKLEKEETQASIGSWKAYGMQQRELLVRQHQVKMEYLIERYEQEKVSQLLTLDTEIERFRNTVKLLEAKIRNVETYNSPGTRTTSGKFTRIAAGGLGARMSLVRTSNYQMKMDKRRMKAASKTGRSKDVRPMTAH